MDTLPDIPVLAGLINDAEAVARHHGRARSVTIA
jgi:hypothetical protein